MQDKKELRKKLRISRKSIRQKCDKERLIASLFLSSELFENCENLFVYVSTSEEVSTIEIIKKALENKKKVAVPVSSTFDNSMDFFEIHSFDDLEISTYNIFEPKKTLQKNPVFPDENSLIILPGIAFSKTGHRIGYGKGYYDRYIFENNKKSTAIGLCFEELFLDEIPFEKHDIPADYIITQSGVFRSKIN